MAILASDFPRCAAYLKRMNVSLADPSMDEYNYAIIIGEEAYSEEGLALAGVAFTGHRQEGLLRKLEVGFPRRLGAASDRHEREWLDQADMDRLRAYFGSRGVKAGQLRAVDDFWRVALILWPASIKRTKKGLPDLLRQIAGMTKAQRQSATSNVAKVPAEFMARSRSSALVRE
ncbi:MAG: hypothetical protein DI629_12280 [Mesorhizobium amorphae]|nr:MAG: hypothetical protein DI629_12280 [Mesorhizobium amorphae]